MSLWREEALTLLDAFEIIRERLEKRLSQSSSLVIGLSGPQGCGKSTVSAKLKEHFGAECAVLGLDDFYLAKAEREQLGQAVSPLFETRGPPGTHDIGFLTLQLDALLSPNSVLPVFVPRFDKTNDDRRPKASWFTVESRPSLIIIEGWCVGAIPSPDFCTAAPLNGAERRDQSGAWRKYQQAQLEDPYSKLWDRIDIFFHFDAPSFETVLEWRLEQEAGNLSVGATDLDSSHRQWVREFIQHYERLSRSMAAGYRRQGMVLKLNSARGVVAVEDTETFQSAR